MSTLGDSVSGVASAVAGGSAKTAGTTAAAPGSSSEPTSTAEKTGSSADPSGSSSGAGDSSRGNANTNSGSSSSTSGANSQSGAGTTTSNVPLLNGGDENKGESEHYIVSMLSAEQLFLSKKELLTANSEHFEKIAGRKRHERYLAAQEARASESEVIRLQKLLVAAQEKLVRDRRLTAHADQGVTAAEEDAHMAWDLLCPEDARVDVSVKSKGGDGIGNRVKREGNGGSSSKPQQEEQIQIHEAKNSTEGKLAGKRSREEDESDVRGGEEEPAKKAAKLDQHVSSPCISSCILRRFVHDALNEHRKKQGMCPIPLPELVFCTHRETGTVFSETGDAEAVVPETVLSEEDVIVGVRHFPELTFQSLMKPFRALASVCDEDGSEDPVGNSGNTSSALSSDNPERGGSQTNSNTSADSMSGSNVTMAPQAEWWENVTTGQGPILSESHALDRLAFHLASCGEMLPDGNVLLPKFCKHYWPELDVAVRSNSSDLSFAAIEVTSPTDDIDESWPLPSQKAWIVAEFQLLPEERSATRFSNVFPNFSAQFFVGLACTWDEGRYSKVKKGGDQSFMQLLRILLDLGYGAFSVQKGGPFSWPPQGLMHREFYRGGSDDLRCHMLLVEAYHESAINKNSYRSSLGKIILQLFEHSQKNTIECGVASDEAEAHWIFQKCLLGDHFEEQKDWEKGLAKSRETYEDELYKLDEQETARVEREIGWYNSIMKLQAPVTNLRRLVKLRQEIRKGAKLTKQTVLHLQLS